MNWNQPLRFTPFYQTRVWGGRNLETQFGRRLPDAEQPYGESWEISDRAEALSTVNGGEAAGLTLNDLWTQHRLPVFGASLVNHESARFPLLIKILDACDDLSIQVHPPASVAEALNGEPKTEMWFITQAQEGARLYAGLRAGTDRDQFETALKEGTVADLMHSIQPEAGDCLYLPSGRVHAIGAGLVIFEIQQNSDTTYRVFDWNRTGLDGKPRDLHIEESLRSIDFRDEEPELQASLANGSLVSCEYFHVARVRADALQLGREGENLIVAMVEGEMNINDTPLKAGDFALIPAAMTEVARQIKDAVPGTNWLEIRVPQPRLPEIRD